MAELGTVLYIKMDEWAEHAWRVSFHGMNSIRGYPEKVSRFSIVVGTVDDKPASAVCDVYQQLV